MVEGDEPHVQPERSSVVFRDPMGHNGEEWTVISISPNITHKRYFFLSLLYTNRERAAFKAKLDLHQGPF